MRYLVITALATILLGVSVISGKSPASASERPEPAEMGSGLGEAYGCGLIEADLAAVHRQIGNVLRYAWGHDYTDRELETVRAAFDKGREATGKAGGSRLCAHHTAYKRTLGEFADLVFKFDENIRAYIGGSVRQGERAPKAVAGMAPPKPVDESGTWRIRIGARSFEEGEHGRVEQMVKLANGRLRSRMQDGETKFYIQLEIVNGRLYGTLVITLPDPWLPVTVNLSGGTGDGGFQKSYLKLTHDAHDSWDDQYLTLDVDVSLTRN
ncbi:MAG: hypothetical protein QF893_10435 [Alphaproteobacteria bacterium]|nr:hypothetical protein [Alphaproteobacteria bacterium]